MHPNFDSSSRARETAAEASPCSWHESSSTCHNRRIASNERRLLASRDNIKANTSCSVRDEMLYTEMIWSSHNGLQSPSQLLYIFIRLDGQQTAHNTQLENTIKHNHAQLKER